MKILIIVLIIFLVSSCTNESNNISTYTIDSSSKSIQNQINVQIQNNIPETPKIIFQKEACRNYLHIIPLIENYDEKDFQFVWYVNREKVSEEKTLRWEVSDGEIVCLLYSNHLGIVWSEKV